uniref:carbonyl reductase (NADPH) n=1 Tax=Panagrellus redivivus TaxID=6233 RepID=A0A7E4W2Y6_PANRE
MAPRVFVVTGANKGIGYGIVETLLKVVDGSIIYLTSRNESLGKAAFANLEASIPQRKSELRYHQLEITDASSIAVFAQHLKVDHDGLDVLINNAGFAFKNDATESPEVQAKVTIGINYYGTKLVSNALIPLIRDGGRIVNVCSQAGLLRAHEWFSTTYSKELADSLKNATSDKDIDAFVEGYIKAAEEGNRKEKGYPESAYRVSKAAEIALTFLHARQLKSRNIKVNACCPGYVDTDMSSHKGPRTIQEGADTPVYLATDANAPDGELVYDRKVIEW